MHTKFERVIFYGLVDILENYYKECKLNGLDEETCREASIGSLTMELNQQVFKK